jgi:hypothetical protein
MEGSLWRGISWPNQNSLIIGVYACVFDNRATTSLLMRHLFGVAFTHSLLYMWSFMFFEWLY